MLLLLPTDWNSSTPKNVMSRVHVRFPRSSFSLSTEDQCGPCCSVHEKQEESPKSSKCAEKPRPLRILMSNLESCCRPQRHLGPAPLYPQSYSDNLAQVSKLEALRLWHDVWKDAHPPYKPQQTHGPIRGRFTSRSESLCGFHAFSLRLISVSIDQNTFAHNYFHT